MTKDEELIERLNAQILLSRGQLRKDLQDAADRLEALAQPVVGEQAQALQDHMEQHHGVCLPASAWDAAIAALAASPSPVVNCSVGSCQRHGKCMYLNHPQCPIAPVVGDEGRRERALANIRDLVIELETLEPELLEYIRFTSEAKVVREWLGGSAILSSTPVTEEREALRVMLTAFSPYADTVAKREAIAIGEAAIEDASHAK